MNYEVVKDWKFDPNECKFDPGEIHVTPEAKMLEQNGVDLKLYLFRLLRGDWGDGLDDAEKTLADDALEEKNWSVVSEYSLSPFRQLVICTNFDVPETMIYLEKKDSVIERMIDELKGEWEYLSPEQKQKISEVVGKDGNPWVPYEPPTISLN